MPITIQIIIIKLKPIIIIKSEQILPTNLNKKWKPYWKDNIMKTATHLVVIIEKIFPFPPRISSAKLPNETYLTFANMHAFHVWNLYGFPSEIGPQVLNFESGIETKITIIAFHSIFARFQKSPNAGG